MNLSSLRQCIAMVFFIFAVNAAYKKSWLKYFLLSVIAALFHKSAWLLFPLCFFINDRPVSVLKCWLTLIFVLLTVFVFDLSELIIWVAKLFNDPNYLHHAQNNIQNSIRATLLTSIYFIYVLYNLPRLRGKTLVYSKLYLISTILGMLAYKTSMFTRIQMYFDVFSIVTLPLIFYDVQSRGLIERRADRPLTTMWNCVNKYAIPVLVLSVYLLRYYSFFTNPMWNSFFDYKTIFSTI